VTVPLLALRQRRRPPCAIAAVRAQRPAPVHSAPLLLHALFDSDRPLSAEELAGDGDVAVGLPQPSRSSRASRLVTPRATSATGPGALPARRRPREFVSVRRAAASAAPLPGGHSAAVREAGCSTAIGYRARFTPLPARQGCARACASEVAGC
jgi:hypothetical protein